MGGSPNLGNTLVAAVDRSTEAHSSTSRRLLVVEGDRTLGPRLVDLLELQGHRADLAPDGQHGLHLALCRTYDVIVVDRTAPAIGGIDLVKRLRQQAVTARVMIVATGGTSLDQIEGLDAGADDYMVKPFNVDEFLARIRALLRRPLQDLDLIPLQTAAIDVPSQTVRMADGRIVRLSPREFRLFHLMATRPQHVHTRKHLRVAVFEGAGAPSIVDTYVYYLRNKLGPQSVETVRGLGYRIGTI